MSTNPTTPNNPAATPAPAPAGEAPATPAAAPATGTTTGTGAPTGSGTGAPRRPYTPGGRPGYGSGGGRPSYGNRPGGDSRGGGGGGRFRRGGPIRRKVCRFCAEHIFEVDYKQIHVVRSFMTARGKLLSGRTTGTCAKHQRQVATAIKRAQNIALLPTMGE